MLMKRLLNILLTELQATEELTRYITRRVFVNSCSEDLQVSIAVIGKETMLLGYIHYKRSINLGSFADCAHSYT